MPHKVSPQRESPAPAGPVLPGSYLYRALQLVAAAVARRLSAGDDQHPKQPDEQGAPDSGVER